MAGVVPVPPRFQFSSTTGVALAGGSVDVYLAGSTTRSNTWSDKAQTTLNTNPIVLDASGSCTIFGADNKTYKFVVKNSAGVIQSHLGGDNIACAGSTADAAAAAAAAAQPYVDAAETAQASAEAAATQAELYADASATGAAFYDTITAGLAAVANGDTFGVKAGGSDTLKRPTVFRRDSATAYTELYAVVPASEYDDEHNPLVNVFGASDKGLWFDASAVDGVYQDTAGATPVTASGQTAKMLRLNYSGSQAYPNLTGVGVKDATVTGGWTLSLVTVSADAQVASDGATTADTVVGANGTTGEHKISMAHTRFVGAKYRMRASLKQNSYTKARVAITATEYVEVNLATGAVIAQSANVSGVVVTALSNGYYETSFLFTAAAAAETAAVYVLDAAGTLSFLANGSSIYFDYCYVERITRSSFTQSDATKAPVYTEESGTKFLRFDGSNDCMQALDIDFTGCSAVTAVLALRQNVFPATARMIFEHGPSAVSVGFAATISNGSPVGNFGGVFGSVGGRVGNNSFGASGGSRPFVGTLVFKPAGSTDDDKLRIRVDGVEVDETQSTTSGTVTTGAFAQQTLNLGSRDAASIWSQIDVYAGIIIGRELTAAELLVVEDELRSRLGRTYSVKPVVFSDSFGSTDRTQYLETSPFASTEILTEATTLNVTAYTNLYSTNPSLTAIGVFVNGVYDQSITFSADGYQMSSITLAAGEKHVSLVNGPQSFNSTPTGTFVVSVGADRPLRQVFVPRRRILFYGDSISVGQAATPVMQMAMLMQLRASGYPQSVALEGWGGRSLYDDANTATLRKAFVKKLLSYRPDAIGLLIGTNDYGLSKWSAANFGTAYAALLDDLHTYAPGIRIFCQSPLLRVAPASPAEGNNGFSDNMAAYRTQISNAVTARSTYCTLVDGSAILAAGDLSDGLHPSTAGHTAWADYWKTNVLNW